MKKEETFIDFIIKNRYMIICLVIAFFLIISGILKTIVEIAVVVFVIMFAIYVGKGLQEDKDFLKNIFEKKGKNKK